MRWKHNNTLCVQVKTFNIKYIWRLRCLNVEWLLFHLFLFSEQESSSINCIFLCISMIKIWFDLMYIYIFTSIYSALNRVSINTITWIYNFFTWKIWFLLISIFFLIKTVGSLRDFEVIFPMQSSEFTKSLNFGSILKKKCKKI